MRKLMSILLTGALCCAMMAATPVALCRAEDPGTGAGSSTSEGTDPTKPGDPGNPGDPGDPGDPTDPTDPTKPVDPTDPEPSVQPCETDDPNEDQG